MAHSTPAYNVHLRSPVGWLRLHFVGQQFSALTFELNGQRNLLPDCSTEIAHELFRYFEHPHYTCQWRWSLTGTDFQQKVLLSLRDIPPGQTKTYGQLAEELETSPRAIGQAVRRNPFPIFFPCHRIVAQNGLGGFAGNVDGHLLKVKAWLLSHEGCEFRWSE